MKLDHSSPVRVIRGRGCGWTTREGQSPGPLPVQPRWIKAGLVTSFACAVQPRSQTSGTSWS